MLTKKGVAMGVLIVFVAALVGFLLVSTTLYGFTKSATGKADEVACQTSIALRAAQAIQINTGSGANDDNFDLIQARLKTAPVLCKTIDKKVEGNRDKIKKQIADSIARCWWMFGEGRYEEVLHGSDIRIAPSIFGVSDSPNKCFNCFNLRIEEDNIDGGRISSAELLDYMWTHSPPKESKETNYISYIQKKGGPGMFVNIIEGSIKPRHAYMVTILPKNKDQDEVNWVKWAGIGAMGVGFLGGVACSIVTAGACGPLMMAALSTTAAAGGKAAAAGLTYELVEGKYRPNPGSGGIPGADPSNQVTIEQMYEEREYSSIYLAEADIAQQFCESGDLAGR